MPVGHAWYVLYTHIIRPQGVLCARRGCTYMMGVRCTYALCTMHVRHALCEYVRARFARKKYPLWGIFTSSRKPLRGYTHDVRQKNTPYEPTAHQKNTPYELKISDFELNLSRNREYFSIFSQNLRISGISCRWVVDK